MLFLLCRQASQCTPRTLCWRSLPKSLRDAGAIVLSDSLETDISSPDSDPFQPHWPVHHQQELELEREIALQVRKWNFGALQAQPGWTGNTWLATVEMPLEASQQDATAKAHGENQRTTNLAASCLRFRSGFCLPWGMVSRCRHSKP